ncbi:hypothetical protein HMPREF9695_04155 [Afipia broomeae ATCC 49717]|uniref:Periplasmic protein-like protein n=2 Tax=Afipia broomeae TaxID=56946 RepID=K8P3L5_9BRAD|nr:hypothetical protein HMPREF9695_04155 [Afipia broomeae ATCC 49717]
MMSNIRNLVCIFVTLGSLSAHEAAAGKSFNYDIKGPMIFRSAFNGGNCNGCEWIIAEGAIENDTPEKLKKFIDQKKIPRGSSLRLNSPGGNLLSGIKLGEVIRAAGLFTSVGKTVGEESSFDPETILEKVLDGTSYEVRNGVCASACVYAFVGGVTRFAAKSKIGIHQFYDERSVSEPLAKTASSVDRSADQLLTALLLEYIVRMGIDPRLVSLAGTIPPWGEMRWLSSSELIDLKIDNSETSFTPLSVEPFGASGAYVETVSRSVYYTFRLRLYCRGVADKAFVAFLSNENPKDAEYLSEALSDILKKSSIALVSDKGEKVFPLQLAMVTSPKEAKQMVQASSMVVGASMYDIQNANRLELRSDLFSRNEGNLAYWLSFNLTGDRRKVGIAARSCIK